MKVIGGVIGSFILIILLALTAFSWTLSQLTNPNWLINQAQKANLYGRLSTNLPNYLPNNFGGDISLTKDQISLDDQVSFQMH